MRRCLALLTFLILLPAAGCSITVCNGTGDTLDIHEPGDDGVTLESAECQVLFYDAPQVNGTLIATREGSDIASRNVLLLGGVIFTFDGIRFNSSNGDPDLSIMRSLELCNESGLDVQILPGIGDAIPSTGWLVDPGTTEPFITIAEGVVRFIALSANGENELGHCDVELLDGNRVVWDGVELTCVADDPGDPTALIELRNDSQVDFIYIVLIGQEPGDLDALDPGNFRFVEYPTGAPLTFEAYAQDFSLLDECTLNDPSDGDQVIWTGAELTCVDQ